MMTPKLTDATILTNGTREVRRYEFVSPPHYKGDYIGIVLARDPGKPLESRYITWEYCRAADSDKLETFTGHYDMDFVHGMTDWLDRAQRYARHGYTLSHVSPVGAI